MAEKKSMVELEAFEAILGNAIKATMALAEVEGESDRVKAFLANNKQAMQYAEFVKARGA